LCAGRNYISMVRGRKRYILSRPAECPRLAMLKTGPSARHSGVDWSSPEGVAALAGATSMEVVLEAGDVLYIPAYWFHFIVSLSVRVKGATCAPEQALTGQSCLSLHSFPPPLQVNIQCNARSGTPPQGGEQIASCGFVAKYTEPLGQHTDASPPEHHLAAIAAAAAGAAAAPLTASAGRTQAHPPTPLPNLAAMPAGGAGPGSAEPLPGRRLLDLAKALVDSEVDLGEPTLGATPVERAAEAAAAAAAEAAEAEAGFLPSLQAITASVGTVLSGVWQAAAGPEAALPLPTPQPPAASPAALARGADASRAAAILAGLSPPRPARAVGGGGAEAGAGLLGLRPVGGYGRVGTLGEAEYAVVLGAGGGLGDQGAGTSLIPQVLNGLVVLAVVSLGAVCVLSCCRRLCGGSGPKPHAAAALQHHKLRGGCHSGDEDDTSDGEGAAPRQSRFLAQGSAGTVSSYDGSLAADMVSLPPSLAGPAYLPRGTVGDAEKGE